MKAPSKRYSGKLYCIKNPGGILTVSPGHVIAGPELEHFEISGADSVITAVGAEYEKTVWIHGGNGWTNYYERRGLGKILDIALLNQKILGLRVIGSGPGREIVFLDNNNG